MIEQACASEDQVVKALLSGQWEDVDHDDLRAHVAKCDVCGEVALVAAMLRDDCADARRVSRLPAAGQVWWRAAVRSRIETAQAATQPIKWLHGMTAALLIGAVLAVVGSEWEVIVSGAGWLKSLALAPDSEVASALVRALRQSAMLAAFAVACLVITPVAVYFALSND